MNKKLLTTIFIAQLIVFGLIVTGFLPREVSLYLAAGLIIYVLIAPTEDGVVFFVMSIPLFLALPITKNFDNFNTWRILAILLFFKWIISETPNYKSQITNKFKIPKIKFQNHTKLLILLLLLAILSVMVAGDKTVAIKRVIYFVNLSLVGVVIYDLAGKSKEFTTRLIKSIAVPTVIVTVGGFIQVISTYFIDVYQFMALWGEGIQCRQFGNEWCYIAVHLGNTWLAYYGAQLSLRVFSLFPDSHSFPQFVLLGLPAIFALSILKLTQDPQKYDTLKKMVHTRVSMKIVLVPAMFLIAILSGTRGIWAASLGVLIIVGGVIYRLKKTAISNYYKNIFKYISLYMVVFFLLFAVAYPIFVSPQFLLSKGDWGLFGERIKSIVDFGETSNSQRVEIWKASLESIKQHPLLGVGIGNFPVVLKQNIFLARAGSSAHNIYLHIAAEMGILALVTAIWFLWLVFKKSYANFISAPSSQGFGEAKQDSFLVTYFGATTLFIPWVLIYSLTDIALFDERTFLLFVTTISLILANKKLPMGAPKQ